MIACPSFDTLWGGGRRVEASVRNKRLLPGPRTFSTCSLIVAYRRRNVCTVQEPSFRIDSRVLRMRGQSRVCCWPVRAVYHLWRVPICATFVPICLDTRLRIRACTMVCPPLSMFRRSSITTSSNNRHGRIGTSFFPTIPCHQICFSTSSIAYSWIQLDSSPVILASWTRKCVQPDRLQSELFSV